ncbi:MAG: DNA mismatch repair endonuclease MutL, partial [Fidelibacterota bacterium]
MGKIHRLDSDVRNKIAAGEVVERPASVVKELVENSIDAASTRIEIIVRGGGNVSIQVVDNGEGMGEDDLILAFDRHATSRISTAQDLERIHTLGFRGEALASIASVSRVTALSTPDGSQEGHRITVTHGRASDPEPAPISAGTSVTVQDLFFSVPARRKFLKSPQTELRHIIHTVRRYALSCPGIAFRLVSDDQEVFNLEPGSLEERIGKVFDPTYRKNIIAVDGGKDPVTIRGFVGNLNTVRKRTGEQFLFLNGRYIVDRLMNSAVYSAYESLISRGEFPFFILHLGVPPDQADVNVHPTKIEARFRDQWRIYHLLKSAVTDSLSDILRTLPGLRRDLEGKPAPSTFRQGALSLGRGEQRGGGKVPAET